MDDLAWAIKDHEVRQTIILNKSVMWHTLSVMFALIWKKQKQTQNKTPPKQPSKQKQTHKTKHKLTQKQTTVRSPGITFNYW